MKKSVLTVFAILCLLSTVFLIGLAANIQTAKADYTWTEIIYIKTDGSVIPDTAPILSADKVTYTLTDNIIGDIPEDSSAIVVQRDNITVDGTSHTVQGTVARASTGVDLSFRSNVTIRNMEIRNFSRGIYLFSSSNNIISENTMANNGDGIKLYNSNYDNILGNNITNNIWGIYLIDSSNSCISRNSVATNVYVGIELRRSSNNSIVGNNVTANEGPAGGISLQGGSNNDISGNNVVDNSDGIGLGNSSNNTLSSNNMVSNHRGISLWSSSNCNRISENHISAAQVAGLYFGFSHSNRISGNSIVDNRWGICFLGCSLKNIFYHNNFVGNTREVYDFFDNSTSAWDNGYPSGGNYWSDHTCTGNPSNGSQPYIIDENNADHYPFQDPDGWLKVHNLDTGLDYTAIQEAINAPETLDGHTIFVEKGTYYENVVVNKSLSLTGEDRSTTIIEHSCKQETCTWHAGSVINITAKNVNITGFTVQNSRTFLRNCGIYIGEWSSGNDISNNIIVNNYQGISDYSQGGNNISGNIITENEYDGIRLKNSSGNSISRNNIASNYAGIRLWNSSINSISGNNITDNGSGVVFWEGGHEISCGVIMKRETAVGDMDYFKFTLLAQKRVIIKLTTSCYADYDLYVKWIEGTIPSIDDYDCAPGGGWGTAGICVRELESGTYHILVHHESNNPFAPGGPYDYELNLTCTDVLTEHSPLSSVELQEDNPTYNGYYIWLENSIDNSIYHNNFINNSQQAYFDTSTNANSWDDGYPSGGNCWSNYTGVDLNSGIYQNETGYDWIGDSPYIIDEDNQDNYPLMSPFGSEMQRVQASYRNLWLRNTQLLSDIEGLNSTLLDLYGTVSDLEVQTNRLNSTLELSIDLLNSTLASMEKALMNELGTVRNAMYVFIALTVILIAATVYFAIVKPKIETQSQRVRSHSLSQFVYDFAS